MKKLSLALMITTALFTQSAFSAENHRAISYLTSWGLSDGDAATLAKSKIDSFLLAFGKWDDNGNIVTSDGIASLPDYNAWWMPTAYVTWTQLKFAQPEKKMMLAFGGQTYEEIWSHIDTAEKREKVVAGLAQLLKTPFPVYRKNMKESEIAGECLNWNWNGTVCDMTTYQKAGEVYLDGIDFDFEKAARLTEKENDDLLQLATRLREVVGTEKLISLTTYHVGADPVSCADSAVTEGCSYVENKRSTHHGEVLTLLSQSKDIFDFFNVMAYDAGPEFKYQTAMLNYANAIGDASKVVLGNTINSQWGPNNNFTESRVNNIARTKWQAQNGYGGFFVWTVGASTEQLSVAQQAAYIDEMKDAADSVENESGIKINDLTIKMGRITLDLPTDVFNGKNRIIIQKNGSYLAESYEGKSYYSSKDSFTEKNTVFSVVTDLKEGDIVTVDLYDGKPGGSYNTVLQSLKKETVTKEDVNTDSIKLTSVDVTKQGVTVTLPDSVYQEYNRVMVRKNGQYLGESYNGKSYFAYKVSAPAGQASYMIKNAIQNGDEITVTLNAGKPGDNSSVVLKELYRVKASF
ncbi:glycoside hydrolase family 18 protein [Erwinia psidii]|uniref:Glycoside hydrolase family 18 protein n=1 Tax=Erwinia psidii TaxID=69224 RepID=A0A3N6SHM5_9GAMM|nr:glycoside hydrolase family 18 protein [Erwinia psidii]MCX8958076.1 glycoside hydrolase family 18 protein [Erwinia psidii]MCX8962476.1 glycoside hydrolase family 18 protein [Erwinia psidii]MCX8966390.1 glycoside hydrolase family 18 protein [Erwinia psidii]RQM37056.1 glycoside hydrolase family 18 protein [Erwinia psidii]